MLLLALAVPAGAQPALPIPVAPASATPAPETVQTPLERDLAASRERLQQMRDKLTAFNAQPSASLDPEEAATARQLLEKAERHASDWHASLERRAALRRQRADHETISAAWKGFPEGQPVPVSTVDDLREEAEALGAAADANLVEQKLLQTALDETAARLKALRAEERTLSEKIEQEKDPAGLRKLKASLELKQLASLEAANRLGYLQAVRGRLEEVAALNSEQRLLIERKLSSAAGRTTILPSDLERQERALRELRKGLETRLDEADRGARRADRAAAEARRQLEAMAKEAGDPAKEEWQRITANRESTAGIWRDQIDEINNQSLLHEEVASLQKRRRELFQSDQPADLLQARDNLERYARQMPQWISFYEGRLLNIQDRLQETASRLAATPSGSPYAAALTDQRDALETLRQQLTANLALVRKVGRITDHTLADLSAKGVQAGLGARAETARFRLEEALAAAWNYEVFTADDKVIVDGLVLSERRGVTVGKIVLAIVIIIAGVLLSRLLLGVVAGFWCRRFGSDPVKTNLVAYWLSYLMIAAVVLTAMAMVKIPLTVLAFLGGALAIGLGFGLQNVISNFVSGLILLFEKPIDLGDFVEVEGQPGRVVGIGARSSRIRRFDGVDVLMPNSKLLETPITNWTHLDRRVRFTITLGVAYTADPAAIKDLLEQVARERPEVLNEPAPSAFLEEFGADALIFNLIFWLEIPEADSRLVRSELRLAILQRLRGLGIVIPYPQRVVHLAPGPEGFQKREAT